MLTKFFSFVLSLSVLICLCGCTITESGHSLSAFCKRMNELNDTYNLTPSGYIIDEKNKTLTKFFAFTEKELMLEFEYAEKNDLTTLHIVFDNSSKNNQEETLFVKNSIYAFTNDTALTDLLLTEIDFENAIYNIDINTKNAKIGNTEIILDVTEIGTVISVVQNIP